MTEPTGYEPTGYAAAILAYIRQYSPLAPSHHSPASQCAHAVNVTIERAFQILDELEAAGLIQTERIPPPRRGRGRIIRIEATP